MATETIILESTTLIVAENKQGIPGAQGSGSSPNTPDWQQLIRAGYVADTYPISFRVEGKVTFFQLSFPSGRWGGADNIAPEDSWLYITIEAEPVITWTSGIGRALTEEAAIVEILAVISAGLDPARYTVTRPNQTEIHITLVDGPRTVVDGSNLGDSVGVTPPLVTHDLIGDVYGGNNGLYGYNNLAAAGNSSDYPCVIYTPDACSIIGVNLPSSIRQGGAKAMIDIQYCGRVLALGVGVTLEFPLEGGCVAAFAVPHGLPDLAGGINVGTFSPGVVASANRIAAEDFIWWDATSLRTVPGQNVERFRNAIISGGHTHLVLFPTILRGGSGVFLDGSYSFQFVWDPATAMRAEW